MVRSHNSVIIGLGSWNGDDQIGWRLADCLCGLKEPMAPAFALKDPMGILGHLEGCEHLVVVDACLSGAEAGSIFRLTWPDSYLGQLRSETSHTISLSAGLQLAEQLGTLPSRVVIYAVEAGQCHPTCKMSKEVEQSLPRLAQLVLCETAGVCHA